MQTRDMTSGPPARLILQFALPLMLGNVFQQFYTFVDTMVGIFHAPCGFRGSFPKSPDSISDSFPPAYREGISVLSLLLATSSQAGSSSRTQRFLPSAQVLLHPGIAPSLCKSRNCLPPAWFRRAYISPG